MSSSPSICASPNFTFPSTNSPRDTPGDYFTMKTATKPPVLSHFNQSSPQSSTRSRSISSQQHPKLYSFHYQDNKSKPVSNHKAVNDSISSITSNTSDLTIYETSFNKSLRTDSIVSNDTLVDEDYKCEEEQNVEKAQHKNEKPANHNFKLNLARRPNKSLSMTLANDLLTCNEAGEAEESASIKAVSASETSFPFPDPNNSSITSNTEPNQTSNPPRSSSNLPFLQSIKKQTTLPSIPLQNELSFDSIKHEQLRRLHSLPTVNYRSQIENLSQTTIKYLGINDTRELLKSDTTDKLLVLDIRPFADYVKSHVKDAINVCLPSTLLKRSNFTLHRCINSLPNFEKFQFEDLFSSKNGKVFIYDHYENSANLYHICNKIVNSPLYNDAHHSIYLVDASLSHFNEKCPDLLVQGTNPSTSSSATSQDSSDIFKNPSSHSNLRPAPTTLQNPSSTSNINIRNSGAVNNLLSPLNVEPKGRAHSVVDLTNLQKSGNDLKRNATSIDMDNLHSSTPILSKFSLPKISGGNIFKIRHNEELNNLNANPFDFTLSAPSTDYSSKTPVPASLSQNTSNLFRLNNLPKDKSSLPNWLQSTIYTGDHQSNKINDDFYTLEKYEQKRLITALSFQNPASDNGVLSPMHEGEVAPTISCGIEYGHKNRYKDIFLFEHSRVKLIDQAKKLDVPTDEDYINASYLDPIEDLDQFTNASPQILKHLKFIATQGPLEQTMGDFWKCIVKTRSPIVLSLTDEIENGVMKCSPFWKSGVYRSNQEVINLKLTGQVQVNPYLILRTFSMTMSNQQDCETVSHDVFQIHLLSWPDMGTISSPLDIIQIIQLKHYMLEKMTLNNCAYPTVIHCSAGCGRTGTLGAIDTVINILKNNNSTELKSDPIRKIVNNFRKQRISMVQNLRQYYSIYEIVLNYLNVTNSNSGQPDESLHWDDLTKLDIVNDFIANSART